MKNTQIAVGKRLGLGVCLMILSFSGNVVRADSAGAESAPAHWQALVDKSISQGTPTEVDRGELRTLAHIVPSDKTKPHQADYFSTYGVVSQGKFAGQAIYAVSENWRIDANRNWDVDQWLYVCMLSGELVSVHHFNLIETPDGAVVDDKSIPNAGPADAAILQQWNNQLGLWYGWAGTETKPSSRELDSLISRLPKL